VRRAAALAALLLIAPAAARAACTVSATPVAFGAYSPFSGTPTDSTGTATVRCTPAANVVVALSTGGSGTFSPRQMSSGPSRLGYQLYSNAARTTVWGNGTGGTVTVAARVTGAGRNFTAFGRIPALQGVAPGAYVDTITVTVTF
jgi:spore coat protein U-like protein